MRTSREWSCANVGNVATFACLHMLVCMGADYYNGAQGFILVYDVTRKSSFINICREIDIIRRKPAGDVSMVCSLQLQLSYPHILFSATTELLSNPHSLMLSSMKPFAHSSPKAGLLPDRSLPACALSHLSIKQQPQHNTRMNRHVQWKRCLTTLLT